MSEISLVFTEQWDVRLPIVTRSSECEYVDAFFKDGSIRLSSFRVFRNHPEETRRDKTEGFAAERIQEPDGEALLLGANAQEAYILCATIGESVALDDSSQCFFLILDTVAFTRAISQQITGFVGGVEGPCLYRADTLIQQQGTGSPIARVLLSLA